LFLLVESLGFIWDSNLWVFFQFFLSC
jgi:hypothetical protein